MLTVLSVHGNRVRIGVEAPSDVAVDRQEVDQRKIEDETTVLDQSRDVAIVANKMEAVE